MTRPTHRHLRWLAEMAMRWVCHLIDHHFRLKQLLKIRYQMAAALSVSRQQHTLDGKLLEKILLVFTKNGNKKGHGSTRHKWVNCCYIIAANSV